MSKLRISLCIAGLLLVVGCGEGYKERKAPPAGTSDPAGIVQELDLTKAAAKPAAKSDEAQPSDKKEKVEPAGNAESEEKASGKAEPKAP